MERAVAWTDGYYGDASSVVQLYKEIHKPILIQAVEHHIPEHDFSGSLNFTDGIWQENKLYFSAWNINGFFCYDDKSGQAELLEMLPADLNIRFLFCRIEKEAGYIHLVPTNESFILIFDIEKKKWDKIYLDDDNPGVSLAGFTDAYRFGNVLWFKPYASRTIVSYSLDTRELEYYYDWYKKALKSFIEGNNRPKFGAGSKSNNAFFFPLVSTNKVVKFNAISKGYAIISVGSETDCIGNAYYFEEKLYCYANKGDLLVYDFLSKELIRKSDIFYQPIEAVSMIAKDGYLWMFACRKDIYAKLNMKRLEVEEIVDEYLGGIDMGYPNPVIRNKSIYLYPNQSPYLVMIDTVSGEIEKRFIAIPDGYEDIWKEKVVEQFPMREQRELSVMKRLIKMNETENSDENEENILGSRIYKEMLCSG